MALTRRQREVLDYISGYIRRRGYAPTLREIADHLGLSSVATVHKHLVNLEAKGMLQRGWNQSRSLVVLGGARVGAVEVPLLGYVAAGEPIEAVEDRRDISVPEDMVGHRPTYVLQVRGDSMIEEHICDGDYVIVEDRRVAQNGETVVALVRGSEATLKKFYREGGFIRLQPANPAMKPLILREDEVEIQGVVIGILRKFR
jgi:repressor LexA